MEDEIIKKAKERFDAELHTEEYKAVHSDERHLDDLLNMFSVKDNGIYLDLGTGNGYIVFTLAGRSPNAFFIGLDIAERSIESNNQAVKDEGKANIIFKSYTGKEFPFESGYFNGMISRYAFHHFPNINRSLEEINRVLKKDGFFILSDPVTNMADSYGFIDEYQNLKDDGHKHFYYENELIDLFKQYFLYQEKLFYSNVRYPRPFDVRYKELIEKYPEEVTARYNVEIFDNKIYIEVKVINILFRKTGDYSQEV
ncbi:MAG: class I SAM-dependent methyltransferase [Spirochaetales bacterium]|nr:class I SAM-dependent methyltransferase [Spirochaetales bacterium]